MSKITIRPATAYDATRICRLLEHAIKDHEGYFPPNDEARTMNWVLSVLNEGYVVLAERSGRVIGSVAVTNYQFPWSPQWFLYTDWMFVQQAFREGGVFEALMKAIHAFADDKGAPVFGGIQSGKDARLKDRLLQMNGYGYLGGQFIREPAMVESNGSGAAETVEEPDDGQRLEETDGNVPA